MFTTWSRRASIVGCRMAASAAMSFVPAPGSRTSTVPGEEMLSSSGVVAPTTPIISPFSSMIVAGAIFGVTKLPGMSVGSALKASEDRMSSVRSPARLLPEKSRFAERYGNWAPSQEIASGLPDAPMMSATAPVPASNSWLPKAEASKPITFMIGSAAATKNGPGM